MYDDDNGLSRNVAEGLEAVVEKPIGQPDALNYSEGGYMNKLRKDAWGSEFIYVYPGEMSEYDIISYGADGEEGGEGAGADITNSSEY